MSRYAESTTVSSEKSRGEIEKTLTRYGADQFMYGWKDGAAVIAFRAKGRHIRFILPLPDKTSKEFTRRKINAHSHVTATPQQAEAAYEQAVRQRWRALALCIKAKLEAVEAGITTFEDEFMAQIILPNGQSMSEHAMPLIARAYETGQMPPLLPHLPQGNA
jgi:hypothetical protein